MELNKDFFRLQHAMYMDSQDIEKEQEKKERYFSNVKIKVLKDE
jgi:hypothetical protein